jgi:hypothetical protein
MFQSRGEEKLKYNGSDELMVLLFLLTGGGRRPRVGKDEVKCLLHTVYMRIDESRKDGKTS